MKMFTPRGGGGYLRNFWVGMCRWDPGTLSVTAQLMSTKSTCCKLSAFGIFCVLRHPNHFALAGANNRNAIITYRGPCSSKSRFFLY